MPRPGQTSVEVIPMQATILKSPTDRLTNMHALMEDRIAAEWSKQITTLDEDVNELSKHHFLRTWPLDQKMLEAILRYYQKYDIDLAGTNRLTGLSKVVHELLVVGLILPMKHRNPHNNKKIATLTVRK